MSLGRTTIRERSCDLVAFATLATLAAGPPLASPVPFYIIGHDQSCLHRLCQVSPPLTAPRVFSRRVRVAVQLFRCRRIAWLPSCCRRLDVAAVLGHAKTIISGHEEQVPAVSRIAFGFTSSDA